MGNNLPPGVSPGDPNAPWNQPDPLDRLPVYCDECGEKVESLEEMDAHRHANSKFTERPPGYQPPTCMVCGDYVESGEVCADCEVPEPPQDVLDNVRYGKTTYE